MLKTGGLLYLYLFSLSSSAIAVEYVQPKVLPKSYGCQWKGGASYSSGGVPLPNQLLGTRGPVSLRPWNIKKGRPSRRHLPKQLHSLSGFPGGRMQIVWSDSRSTHECNLGWSCFKPNDPSFIWIKGIIFDNDNQAMLYCHIIKLSDPAKQAVKPMKGLHGGAAVFEMYEAGWKVGDASRYRCPESLYESVYHKKDLGLKVYYFRIDKQDYKGVRVLPASQWRCNGVKTENFNRLKS
jgi:hypothetical protein